MQTSITLGKFVKEFELENLTPHIEFESMPLTQKYVNRPALQLTGFFDHFDNTRIQIIGRIEHTYMRRQTSETRYNILDKLFSFHIPCIVFCRALEPFPEIKETETNLRFTEYQCSPQDIARRFVFPIGSPGDHRPGLLTWGNQIFPAGTQRRTPKNLRKIFQAARFTYHALYVETSGIDQIQRTLLCTGIDKRCLDREFLAENLKRFYWDGLVWRSETEKHNKPFVPGNLNCLRHRVRPTGTFDHRFWCAAGFLQNSGNIFMQRVHAKIRAKPLPGSTFRFYWFQKDDTGSS